MTKIKERLNKIAIKAVMPLMNRNAFGDNEAEMGKGASKLVGAIVIILFTVTLIGMGVVVVNGGIPKLQNAFNTISGMTPVNP